jgi:tetratricopeptide (TPR) repeat protein
MSIINYPPEEIYKAPRFGKKNFEQIILWMLYNNEECQWSDFTQEPLSFSTSTLSKYLNILKNKKFVDNFSRGHYKITQEGKKRFHEISRTRGKKRKLSYPPEVIKRRRNYDHWILWMLYNNTYCKWSDFLAKPLSINQSSLSKNMNMLLDKGLVKKENKQYKITQSGKLEYSRILQDYDLDRQSILDEESKRIEEITRKTLLFFDKYNIKDEDIQFRFLNNVLRLDYARVQSMLKERDDFDKILLFLSINHPDQFPESISLDEFSKKYGINKTKLKYYIDEIVENEIYPIKFFKLVLSPEENYYFQSDETLEVMLRAITEQYIIKATYLNKLFSRTLDIRKISNDILNLICKILFNKGLKESLSEFLPTYINYLAYKIEAKEELRESYDKLEGIIWQDMINLFQLQRSEESKDQFEDPLKDINKQIESDPENIDLYNSKISILLYYEQHTDILILLDEMLDNFPENEIDIKMKKASVLRRMRDIQGGLDIINELIENYPENTDLLNYKAYWLHYLNRKQEAFETIQNLVDNVPENGTYQDTYGELLMYYEEYEKAVKKFSKAIDVASEEWYINQTYIKLGICYKELKQFDLAIEYLKKGKSLTSKSKVDEDTKQKWLTIADLFLLEIEQLL